MCSSLNDQNELKTNPPPLEQLIKVPEDVHIMTFKAWGSNIQLTASCLKPLCSLAAELSLQTAGLHGCMMLQTLEALRCIMDQKSQLFRRVWK